MKYIERLFKLIVFNATCLLLYAGCQSRAETLSNDQLHQWACATVFEAFPDDESGCIVEW